MSCILVISVNAGYILIEMLHFIVVSCLPVHYRIYTLDTTHLGILLIIKFKTYRAIGKPVAC